MGRKSRHKKPKRKNNSKPPGGIHPDQLPYWQDMEGVHTLIPGLPPTKEKLAEMTAIYQTNIRNSDIFTEMVNQFGQEKAEEMLKEFKIKIKS